MLKQIFAPLINWVDTPRTAEPFDALRIRFINVYLLATILLVVLIVPVITFSLPSQRTRTLLFTAVFLIVVVGTRLLLRRHRLRAAQTLVISYQLTLGTLQLLTEGLNSLGATLSFTVLLVLTGLLLSKRLALLVVAYSIFITFVAAYRASIGLDPFFLGALSPYAVALIKSLTLLAVGAFTFLFVNGLRGELSRRERAEQSVLAVEKRYQTVVEGARGIVFAIALDGTIRALNPAFEQVLGWPRSEWLGQSVRPLVHPDDLALLDALRRHILEADTAVPFTEIRLLHRSGDTIHAEVSASLQPGAAHERIFLGIVRDMTDRKRTEALLHQAQKLDSLGLLAGGIAHDFNNLLVGMLGQTTLALQKLPPDSPARLPLAKAAGAAERAADITRQLLAYSGKGQFEVGPINLNRLIDENMQLFRVAVSRHIMLHTNFHQPLPPVQADRGQMQQVVMNLILNAAQAIGDQKGSISITTSLQSITAADSRFWERTGRPLQPGQYVMLQVRDTGRGIDSDTLQHIFDPFYTTRAHGQGLGLAAVLGIVRGHGGGIQVYSRPGHGTTFKLLFPPSDEPLPEAPPSPGPQLVIEERVPSSIW